MKIERVTSPNNPAIKAIRRAIRRGEPTEDGYCLAEGFHLLEEAVRSHAELGAVIVPDTDVTALEDRADILRGIKVYAVPAPVFTDLASTESPQGIVCLVKIRVWTMDDTAPPGALVVVLDGIQEPGNAGAIVRTAEAFGATGVIALKGTVNGWNPKAVRASAGSLFRIPFVQAIDETAFRQFSERRNLQLFATMPRGNVPLHGADLGGECAIIIGSEGHGVRLTLAEEIATALRIPMRTVESLNAAVAAGVILYEAMRQRSFR